MLLQWTASLISFSISKDNRTGVIGQSAHVPVLVAGRVQGGLIAIAALYVGQRLQKPVTADPTDLQVGAR